MPIYSRKDSKGHFYQYGDTGAKYYYTNQHDESDAYEKALKQTQAIKASEWRAKHGGAPIN
jgi:hypothetical protein